MHACHSHFNPCKFKNYLYICGLGSDSIEAMDLLALTFHNLPLRLPEKNSACCLFVDNEELVIISKRYVTRWGQMDDYKLAPMAKREHAEMRLESNMAPVFNSTNQLLFIVREGRLFRIKVDGSDMEEVGG